MNEYVETRVRSAAAKLLNLLNGNPWAPADVRAGCQDAIGLLVQAAEAAGREREKEPAGRKPVRAN